jgi:hypothetical protein
MMKVPHSSLALQCLYVDRGAVGSFQAELGQDAGGSTPRPCRQKMKEAAT